MAQLNPPAYSGKVRVLRDQRRMIARASDLGIKPGHQWQRLYDNEADVGICIQGRSGGAVTRWYLVDSERNRDGTVVQWMFRACSESINMVPELVKYDLHIVNE